MTYNVRILKEKSLLFLSIFRIFYLKYEHFNICSYFSVQVHKPGKSTDISLSDLLFSDFTQIILFNCDCLSDPDQITHKSGKN